MKIALLGYGKEGQAAEKYFKSHFSDVSFDVFENLTPGEFHAKNYSSYKLVLRSPSIPPMHLNQETSVTKYFFDRCPCPIIGVTATKGKGTTCSFIESFLKAFGEDVFLVGNIGNPALDVLDELKPTSVVVYEMSSFQLWDLQKSPHVAVIGQLEPDHLNVHKDYADYLAAKANITKYQSPSDYLIYYQNNPETVKIAEASKAQKLSYPFDTPTAIQSAVRLPGRHNLENALAAIAAVSSYFNSKNHQTLSPAEFIAQNQATIIQGLQNFKGLPHRLEFVRELNHIKFYDDNFSTNPSSTRVAVNAFPDTNLTIIVGGRDKTHYEDLPEIYQILSAPQVQHIILLGESGQELARRYSDPRFEVAYSLEDAVQKAVASSQPNSAKSTPKDNIILMSPSAASFDMFENVYDRGAKFQQIVNNLKI